MYTYSQLLLRNLILAIVFTTVVVAITFSFSSVSVSQKQHNQQETIKIILSQLADTEKNNIATIAKQLMQNNNYNQLSINTSAGDSIYNKKNTSAFIANLMLAKTSSFNLATRGLNIKIQSNADNEAQFVINMLITIFALSLCCVVIVSKISKTNYQKMITAVCQQIKYDFSSVLDPEEINLKNDNSDQKTPLFHLPELETGLKEIEDKIKHHISDTSLLEKEAYIEPLTQLENRSRFVQFFENQNESTTFGVLTITRCSELQTVNQIHGYHEGDNYICRVAEIIKAATVRYKSAQIFRLNSSDFATVLPNTTLKDAQNYAQELTDKFNEYQQSSDLDSVGYTGLVGFDNDKPLGELLALADTGISVAQTQQINAWYAQTDTDILASSSASYGNQNWRQEINNVLENQRVILLVQHIKPSGRNTRIYGEILARFLNANDEMLPTASFIAMAEKLDKIVDVDRMIIEQAIKDIKSKNLNDQLFGINISSRSIHDEHFLIWLERRLLRDPAIASNLVFEITEYGLQQNIKTSKRFIDMVHRVGSRVTVERFGVGLTSFKFFRDLKPDFIKMDSTYTRDIDEDKNNQYFLRLMVDLAHRLSITVLAESVESQEEKFTLEKLFIDGCQGFYIGKPEKI